jgi:hypothetical protein
VVAALEAREKSRPDLKPANGGVTIRKARLLESLGEFDVFVESSEKFIKRSVEFSDFAPHPKVLMKAKFAFEFRSAKRINDEVVDFFRPVFAPVEYAGVVRPDEENATTMAVDLIEKLPKVRAPTIDEEYRAPRFGGRRVGLGPRIRFRLVA